MKKLEQTGDTIVEVLIAIAVMSSILTAAYAIANRSLTDIRQAQEHSEALKFAESQAESLKQLSDRGGDDNNSANIFTTPIAPFCVVPNLGYLKVASGSANCDLPAVTVSVPYTVEITRTTISAHSYNFSVLIHWPSIHGGTDKVSLNYRLDKN